MTDLSYGHRFASRRMAENYQFRPPYSPELYAVLESLIAPQCRTVLDAGCGPGKITLGLVDRVDRIDAVDPSEEMLRVARSRPKADSPKIRWIHATMEEAPLEPPYGLIVAGLSIHWMNLDRVLPRFASALADGAFLALLDYDGAVDAPWEREEILFDVDFIRMIYGHTQNPWNTIGERIDDPILTHPAFERSGHLVTAPVRISQSVEDYLRCQHSRATWSEDHLGAEAAREFDAGMTKLLSRHAVAGMLDFAVQTRIEWGRIRI
ncbi:MAG TPA: class I SAM-dependent methyltransferase [Candidatus Binataceae bacterium]|nr:class I SAM-dependent methyltransferase [Candidatus Binataceae bacterium]